MKVDNGDEGWWRVMMKDELTLLRRSLLLSPRYRRRKGSLEAQHMPTRLHNKHCLFVVVVVVDKSVRHTHSRTHELSWSMVQMAPLTCEVTVLASVTVAVADTTLRAQAKRCLAFPQVFQGCAIRMCALLTSRAHLLLWYTLTCEMYKVEPGCPGMQRRSCAYYYLFHRLHKTHSQLGMFGMCSCCCARSF